MKRILVIATGVLLLLGASYHVQANSSSELDKAKQILTQNLNIILQATYDQGFSDGYRAEFKAANAESAEWDNTHS